MSIAGHLGRWWGYRAKRVRVLIGIGLMAAIAVVAVVAASSGNSPSNSASKTTVSLDPQSECQVVIAEWEQTLYADFYVSGNVAEGDTAWASAVGRQSPLFEGVINLTEDDQQLSSQYSPDKLASAVGTVIASDCQKWISAGDTIPGPPLSN